MFTKTDIENYFTTFKTENLVLIILGGVAVLLAIFFFAYYKTPWHKGFAVPVIVFGMMHCIAGYTNYKKADALRVRNAYTYDMNPSGLRIQELPRLKEQHKTTNKFIYLNIGFLAAAVFLFVYFRNKPMSDHYSGVAAGLFIMAMITLCSSLFMQYKTQEYIKGIESFTKEFSSDPAIKKPL